MNALGNRKYCTKRTRDCERCGKTAATHMCKRDGTAVEFCAACREETVTRCPRCQRPRATGMVPTCFKCKMAIREETTGKPVGKGHRKKGRTGTRPVAIKPLTGTSNFERDGIEGRILELQAAYKSGLSVSDVKEWGSFTNFVSVLADARGDDERIEAEEYDDDF